ncbi:MAG: DNA-directed RNA polymerase subunit beta' [Gammaproteobacteria bacterium]
MIKPASIFSAIQGDRKDDFSSVALSLASPEKIRTWSYGEVRLPETINYRTFKPEPGGLFCAKIFGPIKDYECLCGKYKRMKYRSVICEKCGVEVTTQKVRRERMGHIKLACPVAHILFFKSLPSRIALMMDLTMRDIERILYYEAYVVLDPKRLDGKKWRDVLPVEHHGVMDDPKRLDDVIARGSVMSVKEYQDGLCASGGNPVVIGIGAEGLHDFLKKMDMDDEVERLQLELNEGGSETRRKKALKRLKLAQNFRQANLRPEWMILRVLPVLPADLRPLVQLEGGRFTNSDINDLYRRVINRNNRLTRLTELGAPEVIVNNEKRMLQEAVDALLDNGRRGKPAVGSNKRPLKSLADTVKGKSGRFRQNLLGKRVDFSGRSAIVVGPNLKLHQCGLPKQMALQLFRPFVFNSLIKQGYAGNIKQARQKVDEGAPEVWDVLDDVIRQHPVLLNRAPTLHRLGIQAFEPVLIEGKAIQLHPLVCVAFNADFDGDQMAVHVPLSVEAQAEARVLMLSSNNILAPANGEPVIVPTQDVVFGLYYTTRKREGARGAGMRFADAAEVERALDAKVVSVQAEIELLTEDESAEGGDLPKVLVKTTVGRALIKRFLPRQFPTISDSGEEVPGRRMKFAAVNKALKKRDLAKLVNDCFRDCGLRETVVFCDKLMRFGFEMATRSGLSMCVSDMRVPQNKAQLIGETEEKIRDAQRQYQGGLLTESERYNKSVDEWDDTGEKIAKAMMDGLSRDVVIDEVSGKVQTGKDGKQRMQESFNSIYMMADSGARGSPTQIKQLAGMRGLMARPDGRIMERAITANFREGLSVLQYFIATHGGRKGLTDTALKTANSGYLTRRLVDVTQDVVIIEKDCGSTKGIILRAEFMGGEEVAPLRDRILGRFLAKDVSKPQSGEKLFAAGEYLDEARVLEIDKAGVDEVVVRSPVMCLTRHGLCAKCYGRDLGRGDERDEKGVKKQDGVALGEAVGIIAAQSIGEPGTQLTMRTFHIGGAASSVAESEIRAKIKGKVKLSDTIRHVINSAGEMIVVSQGGEISVHDENGQERERHRIQYGDIIKVKDGGAIAGSEVLIVRDPLMRPIVAEFAGKATLENVDIGYSADEQMDESTGLSSVIIREKAKIRTRSGKKGAVPQLKFVGKDGNEVKVPGTKASVTISLSPSLQGAVLILGVRDGQQIRIGDIIAREPLQAKSRDITGGLPRVAELFEARQPSDRDSAMLAGADGRVALRGVRRTKQILAIIKNYQNPPEATAQNGRDIAVKQGDNVKKDDIIIMAEDGIVANGSGKVVLGEREGRRTVKIGNAKKIPIHRWRELSVKDGDEVAEGDEIAAPLDAVRAPIAARVEISDAREGTLERVMILFDEHEHLLPKDAVIRVQDGSIVKKGEEIVEGKINPHNILKMRGLEALVEHIAKEVQEVYRLQGVSINDKHIEVIVRQMMRSVEVRDPGDTTYLPGDRMSYVSALEENERLAENGKKPMKFERILLGITKASLQTDSFISEASFQETTRVLTDAAVRGRRDYLRGLKENIIVGRLIPAGTGFVSYRVGERDRLAEEAEDTIRVELQEQGEQQPDQQPEQQPDNPAA